jgi:hypothetical protein
MYKNLYENAGKLAEQIRGGTFSTPSKQTMEREAGLFARRNLETLQRSADDDPVETISRYIAGIRDSAIRDPQEAILGASLGDEGPRSIFDYLPSSDNFDYSQVSDVDAMSDETFTEAAEQVAANLNIPVNWMYAVIENESGFDPSIPNQLYVQQGRGADAAVGLIQFMPDTARALGTSTEELAGMSRTDQLVYVERYLEQYSDKIQSPEDVYLATFYPRALGEDDSFVIGSERSNSRIAAITRDNPIFDLNRDGGITVGEVKQFYRNSRGFNNFIAPFQNSNEG